jgi:putative addiction module component (TIGR02574 family)
MSTDINRLLAESLSLDAPQRASLARQLILSLEKGRESRADELWLAEIERRAREIDDGTVAPLDWENVRESILRRLNDR